MPINTRPHIILGIITLVLALAILVVILFPKPAIRIMSPPDKGGIPASGYQSTLLRL